MEKVIYKVLKEIHFAEKYAEICNSFSNFNNGINFRKSVIIPMLEEHNLNMTYASREKLFYTDIDHENISIRFSFSTKHGFVEAFYVFRSSNGSRVLGRFNSIAKIEKEDFDNNVKHPFPIATSVEDLKSILDTVFKLHQDYISNFLAHKF